MDLTISIVNYNNKDLLPALLKSISKSTITVSHEIIIVDNNSKDGSPLMIRSKFPQIKLIQNQTNVGFAKAHNQAIKESKGRYVLMLNPDIVLKPDAIQNMLEFMESHPEAGIIGGKILNPDGTIQLSGKKFPTPLVALFLTIGIHKLFPKNPITREYYMPEEKYDEIQEVEHVIGLLPHGKREAIEKVGLMDENFFLYCEDVDWGMRIKQGGFKIYYIPNAEAIHHKGGSSKKESYRMIIEHHKSLWYFYKKWYSKKYPLIVNFLFYIGVILRKWVYLAINFLSTEKKVRY